MRLALLALLLGCSSPDTRGVVDAGRDVVAADAVLDAASDALDAAPDSPDVANPVCDEATCPEPCCGSVCCPLMFGPDAGSQPRLYCCKGSDPSIRVCMTLDAWDVDVCGELP